MRDVSLLIHHLTWLV